MADGGGKVSPQLAEFIQQEQAKAQIQQTVARVTEVCWDKCVGYPGRALSSRESSCMADCAKRFVETTQFIVQRFQAKAGAEGGGGGGSGLFE